MTTPAPKNQRKTLWFLGCVTLIGVAIIGMCALSFGGMVFFGGIDLRAPTNVTHAGTATPTIPSPATPTSVNVSLANLPPALRTALLSSVYIVSADDTGKRISSGSGTLLTPQGHILTNFHVVGDTNTGKLDNKYGLAYIGINSQDLNAKPTVLYLAQFLKGDKALDVALLRIVANRDGSKLAANLNLTPVPIGDSDQVQIGEDITVIGFHSLGEGTVTLTKGTVAGFVDDPTSVGTWIKTDAEINHGNSGGMAINRAGAIIGIPSETISDNKSVGKIGYIRPINFAKSLTQFALRDAQSPVAFSFAGWSPSTTRVPATSVGSSFAQIIFCDDVKDGKPVNPRTTFPAGIKKVTAYWTFKGMANGQEWGRRWLQGSQVIVDKLGQQWSANDSGSFSISYGDDQGLEAGTYELQLYIGKTLTQKAAFSVVKTGGVAPTAGFQTASSFGKIVFARDVTSDNEPVNITTNFPPSTTKVWTFFTYLNLKNGDAWGRKWLRDGTVVLESNATWTTGPTGRTGYGYALKDNSPLLPGKYEFVLYLGGKEIQRASFVVMEEIEVIQNDCGHIPAGIGGLAVINHYDREINYTIGGELYKIPPKGDEPGIQVVYLPPGSHTFSANIPGIGGTNGNIDFKESVCLTQQWASH